MSSRLDRLFLLLDTGSSPVTRKAAAIQLGEVQKMHPHELHNLLAKVRKYLHSNSWDTRIAAGQAIEAIISNVPQWEPVGVACKKEDDLNGQSTGSIALEGRMKFSRFDIHRVMQCGSNLLASEGKEFEEEGSKKVFDNKDLLFKQRQVLNKRLGLDMAEKLGLDTSEIFSNEDLNLRSNSLLEASQVGNKKALSEVFDAEIGSSFASSRDMKAKRRARLYAKQRSKDASFSNQSKEMDDVPANKKLRRVTSVMSEKGSSDDGGLMDTTTDSDGLFEEQSKNWPLDSFCDQLINDLFSPSWEIRHGAATAIREIIRLHGKGAGKTTETPADQMDLVNQLWLEDIALRLLCVLALDKFGDYISDQVVAPVRETCAQALGAMLNQMWESGAKDVLQILLQLLQRSEWEARHGGLLGVKYMLAVREDLRDILMPIVFEPLFKGLQDPIDDVSAVAAAALVPVTDALVQMLPKKVPLVISLLWDMLLELDDLTASTSCILILLASLLSYPVSSECLSMYQSLTDLVPRLWPFLSHNSSVVRKSVLQTLVILTSESNPQACEVWLLPILADALRLIYQRCLVENKDDIHELLYKVWYQLVTRAPLTDLLNAACPFLSGWLCMLMHPSRVPIDPQLTTAWLEIRHKSKEKCFRGRKSSSNDSGIKEIREQFYIGGSDAADQQENWEKHVMKARCMIAKFLGLLSRYITKPVPGIVYTPEMESPVDCFARLLLFHLNSKSALQRMAVALVLMAWAEVEPDNPCPQSVKDKCLSCLNENIYFDEIAISFARVQQGCSDFMALLRHHKLPLDSSVFHPGVVLTLDQATLLSTAVFKSLISSCKLKPKVLENLEERRKTLYRSVTQTSHDQVSFSTTVLACLGAALVGLKCLPVKLNPVIRPLMESIKKEDNLQLQKASGVSLVHLMELCIERQPCPNTKVLKNVTSFLCSDPNFTPSALKPESLHDVSNHNPQFSGILTLVNMQKCAEKVTLRRSNSVTVKKALPATGIASSEESANSEDENQKLNELQRRGATFVFEEAASHFGADLPEKLPTLWEATVLPLTQVIDCTNFDGSKHIEKSILAQELVTNLQVLEVTGPTISPKLQPHLVSLLPHVVCCLEHPYTSVRHMAARCLGMLGWVLTEETMDVVLMNLLSKIGASDSDVKRQGAVEGIACLIEQLALKIIPYIVLLVVPMLGRMSDQNEPVRLLASHCFASLIRLMPLEGGIRDPPNLREELVEKKLHERQFLEQLLDAKKLKNFKIPVQINAELRSYQQEGVNWLAFLNKYKLHGILCDDMGLGKTLQSLCILAADHYSREQIYKEKRSTDCKPLPSLVVCPPTLTGHWVYEVTKFLNERHLDPLHYTGPPAERIRLRNKARKHNLIVASYDIVRNDIDFFGSIHWNYCILDEGHIIKNGKTKLARAVKQLSANHRLILTGTPIQNNVLDLWSLFDFLMPGFLGTEKQFTARYSKPILQSRDAKSSSKEQEAGILAMESLHRQVLPFLLCRMKEDVLKDLPPKIIQDYYCDLSPLQVQLYEDFAKSRARQSLEDNMGEEENVIVRNTSHIFQALQYLRKVCNHPKLVLTPQHPEFERVTAQLKQQNSNLSDTGHAAKLSALRQLLLDCGIGTSSSSSSSEPEPVVNQHRALVFCQLKSMLDILEVDLLKKQMPSVTYLRLDGSIPPGQRHSVVHRFNNDPSIDILLLTTQVGGLGLNLTGADTVIFVEHDWNPMKDLQAMDRAHRIGQKKVVNVYRLITRGTLEEKIMGLQKFKLTIANTVISQENSSLQTMGTDQLLDLFLLGETKKSSGNQPVTSRGGMKAVLENLPDLWDTDQYENEYDVGTFMQSLRK